MISLAVWTVLLVSQVFFPAWACARAARAVGSPRGRLGVGLLVVLAVLVVNVAALLLFSLVPPRRVTLMLLAGVSVAQLLTLYVLLGVSFRLSAGRTFAPLAGYVGATLACLAIAYLIVRPFVTQAFVMPAAAMAPTLNTGDRFFVNKRLEPRRWDVVAYFTSERDWRTESEEREVYCLRLVGLPGE